MIRRGPTVVEGVEGVRSPAINQPKSPYHPVERWMTPTTRQPTGG